MSLLSVYSFGDAIRKTSNVLDNVSEMDTPESYILRVFYLVIAASHIPFIFYPGKEAGLVLIAEIKDGAISRMQENKSECVSYEVRKM